MGPCSNAMPVQTMYGDNATGFALAATSGIADHCHGREACPRLTQT